MSEALPESFVADLLRRVREARDAEAAAAELAAVAAPRLLGSAGGPEGLARVLGNDLFAPLLEADHLQATGLQRIDATARAHVEARAGDGAPARFTLSLARRADGEGAPAWCVTGLVRAERSDA